MFCSHIRWSLFVTVYKQCLNTQMWCVRMQFRSFSIKHNSGYLRESRKFGWNTCFIDKSNEHFVNLRPLHYRCVDTSYLNVGNKQTCQFIPSFRTFFSSRSINTNKDFQDNTKLNTSDENKDTQDIKEKILTVPNALTVSRIIATPFIGYLVVQGSYPLAFSIFCVAGITDVLDGYIARKFNQKTALGSALDPLADKLFVNVLAVTLTSANLIPVALLAIILGRDVIMIAASLYLRYISLPPPKTISRYCDLTHATVQLHPSNLSKLNTFLQITLIASSLAAPVFGFIDHIALQTLWYLTGGTTIASGVGYYITRNKSVQFLQDKMKKKL